MNAPAVTLFVLQDDGCVVEQALPTRFEVCPRCEGNGKHDHPAFSNGITGEEWNGPDWDDESREAYMSGGYDVHCEECNGERVVPVLDRERCTPEQLKAFDEQEEDERQTRAEEAMERRMGA